ncbi:helix-turn-helix transcriptional regulator [uncultured Roseobacter sp.]|uniref:helix-turn-helix transcriptional regulator n=1 Tax=uncultured Roseobacter sp. TaxID=114847 RepID=UPI0034568AAC
MDIAPISDSDSEVDQGLDGALVTIIDPERIPYLRLERFTELYGLTQAETDVCRWIAEGASIAEIAERRGTSPTTAKNQVSMVLSKAGVGSRLEFIRLILRVLPPVA